MRQRIVEKLMHVLFFIAACASVLAVVLICLFLFRNGIPAIGEIGITKFLLGQKWKPSNNLYGILPFILGSIYVTAGSIVVGVPTAIPGILSGVILATGRIVGETAALLYTAGSVAKIPNLMGSGRTLAVHMYVLSSEGLYMDQAYATAVVLLVFVLVLNGISNLLAKQLTKGRNA